MGSSKRAQTKYTALATVVFLGTALAVANAAQDPVGQAFGLTAGPALPFPTSALPPDGASDFLRQNWQVGGKTPQTVDFAPDPAGMDDTVLRVTYEAGSWSQGGANFFVPFGNSTLQTQPKAMLLYYEVFFGENFDFVKGGKLPGLRGGPQTKACSGGREADGSDCFSSRLMWREQGAGEGEQF